MIKFTHTYANLPEQFYSKTNPSSATNPSLIIYNKELCQELGMDTLQEEERLHLFSGKQLPESANPIALAYAGHQFGHFVPRLGDGRAVLLGELIHSNGQRFDVQLKGAGKTFYSRRGDGLSSLGPVIREYILSESMYALGVPTTRALAAVASGDTVFREKPLPGGIFTRVAKSHLRVGTFEYFAARKDHESLKTLCDYAIERHYPEIQNETNKYLLFLRHVGQRQLELISSWMSIGFIHGVMNTDNTSICGETLDFGPCAFMDQYSADKTFSYIDRYKRYAYNNQPLIARWNLSSFANCLVPLIDQNEKKAISLLEQEINQFEQYYNDAYLRKMSAKLGIFEPTADDQELIADFLQYLEDQELDFTNSFRKLSQQLNADIDADIFKRWHKRREQQSQTDNDVIHLMNGVNPAIIARNHQVEKAIQGSIQGDYSHFFKLVEALRHPYQDQDNDFDKGPTSDEVVTQTFCGT